MATSIPFSKNNRPFLKLWSIAPRRGGGRDTRFSVVGSREYIRVSMRQTLAVAAIRIVSGTATRARVGALGRGNHGNGAHAHSSNSGHRLSEHITEVVFRVGTPGRVSWAVSARSLHFPSKNRRLRSSPVLLSPFFSLFFPLVRDRSILLHASRRVLSRFSPSPRTLALPTRPPASPRKHAHKRHAATRRRVAPCARFARRHVYQADTTGLERSGAAVGHVRRQQQQLFARQNGGGREGGREGKKEK